MMMMRLEIKRRTWGAWQGKALFDPGNDLVDTAAVLEIGKHKRQLAAHCPGVAPHYVE